MSTPVSKLVYDYDEEEFAEAIGKVVAAFHKEKPKKEQKPKPIKVCDFEELKNVGKAKTDWALNFIKTRRGVDASSGFRKAIAMTRERSTFEEQLTRPFSKDEYLAIGSYIDEKSIDDLRKIGFLEKSGSRPLGFAYIFPTKKSNGRDRVITHPPELNKRTLTLPLKLAGFVDILHWAEKWCGSDFFTFECDFKNYYPQIPIGGHMRECMGIWREAAKDEYLRMAVLAQGWSLSCHVAQALTWIVVGFVRKGDDDLGLMIDWADEVLPGIVKIQHKLGTGFIAVIYDNILVLTDSEELRNLWRKRIIENRDHFNVLPNPDHDVSEKNGFSFIGLRVERDVFENSLKWKLDPKKFDDWMKEKDVPIKTARHLVARAAKILRWAAVRAVPIAQIGRVTKIVSDVQKEIQHKQSWDIELHEEEWAPRIEVIRERFASLNNEFVKKRVLDVRGKVWWCVTDATTTSWAFVIFSSDQTPVECTVRSGVLEETTMDISEATAVEKVLEFLSPRLAAEDLVLCGMDNVGTALAYAFGWAGKDEIDSCVAKGRDYLKGATFASVDIPSGENVADSPSRNTALELMRIFSSLERLRKAKRILESFSGPVLFVPRSLTEGEKNVSQ